ncbi:hypothetical protein MKleb_1900 [Klebsiella sp. PL-2018]|nr:hypothetical protein MKleb_1900 [Klebsiella sp. PL-2018]
MADVDTDSQDSDRYTTLPWHYYTVNPVGVRHANEEFAGCSGGNVVYNIHR